MRGIDPESSFAPAGDDGHSDGGADDAEGVSGHRAAVREDDERPEHGREASLALGARELFVAHASFVARFLARLGVRAQELDDLVQEVFLVAHRHGGFVPGRGKATTWLAEIAIRVTSNARRTERRRREDLGDETLTSMATPGGSPLSAVEANETLTRIQQALDALDLDHRAVFILFEIEGEPCEVIAAGLGIPVGTVHSRLFTARKAFGRAYDRLQHARVGPRCSGATTGGVS